LTQILTLTKRDTAFRIDGNFYQVGLALSLPHNPVKNNRFVSTDRFYQIHYFFIQGVHSFLTFP
jgi:hypothetical protein